MTPKDTQNDPIKNYYRKGYDTAKEGKRQSARTPQNFKLAYANGYWDAKLNRAKLY